LIMYVINFDFSYFKVLNNINYRIIYINNNIYAIDRRLKLLDI
jgi:hypothetical protein